MNPVRRLLNSRKVGLAFAAFAIQFRHGGRRRSVRTYLFSGNIAAPT